MWKIFSTTIKYFFTTNQPKKQNMFCLNQFNTLITKFNFKFGYCCVWNENKFIHNDIWIYNMWYLQFSFWFKIYENLLRMNLKYHFENDLEFIQKN
jgi:hypothetical protein